MERCWYPRYLLGRHRKQAASQKLQEQAALLNITADAIFVRDMRHDIVYWNKGAEQIFGWSSAEAIGKNADDLLGTHAPDSMHAYEIVLEKGEWIGEFHRKSRDGRELTIQARGPLSATRRENRAVSLR